MNVAEFLILIARRLGADTAFTLTGGMAMHLNRAAGSSDLRVIYCHHEQACVAAADGYAKVHEYARPGLAIVTSGPGVTNALTSLASAYHDSVPIFLFAGQVKSADINRHGVRSHGAQEVPSLDLVRPIVKDMLRYEPALVEDARLAEVFAAALSGRKGPVFIEVPLDVQPLPVLGADERIDALVARVSTICATGRSFSAEDRASIEAACGTSQRPVVFIGNGVRIAGISRSGLLDVLEALGAPVLTTWPSADILDAGHPQNFGCPGGLAPTHSNRILQRADLVIFLGVRLDLLTTAFNPERFGKRARRVVVDLDPSELGKLEGLPNVHCIQADARSVVRWLSGQPRNWLLRDSWMESCEALRSEDAALEAECFRDRHALNARNVAIAFANMLRNSTIAATGSGYAIEGFARFFAPRHGNRLFFAGHCLGSMGLGLPSAVGAAAEKSRRVIGIEGDGGVMLNLQELATLQANPDIELALCVLNNGGYQSISRSQHRAFGSEYGASPVSGVFGPDLQALAAAFGLGYAKAEDMSELEDILAQIQGGRSRMIVDIRLGGDDYRGPSVVTRFRDDGTPYSSDIEEAVWRQLA